MAAASKEEVAQSKAQHARCGLYRRNRQAPVYWAVEGHAGIGYRHWPRRMVALKFLALMATTAAGLIASTAGMEPTIVTGMITDEANGAIPAAVVEMTCIEKGQPEVRTETKSGEDGRWEIGADIKGRCRLKISAVGFAPVLLGISSPTDRPKIDVGKTRLKVSCSGPGVVCDEVTPGKDSVPEPPKKK
jgi:hypothetical protein